MKPLLYAAASVALTLAVTAGVLLMTFSIERHRARFEAAAAAATGIKIGILGRTRYNLLPPASLSLEDLFVQNRGLAVVSARQSVARIRLLRRVRRTLPRFDRAALSAERRGRR